MRTIILSMVLAGAAFARPVSDRDLWSFTWIGDPQVSPDGSRVAFARVVVNEKHLGYETSIWVVSTQPGNESVRLTSGLHDGSPRWSPDGKYLAFARALEKDGKPQPPQLYVLPMSGGEPQQLTDLPKGAGNPHWSPDGKSIAFASDTNAEDLAKKEKKPAGASEAPTPSSESAAEQGKATPENERTAKPPPDDHESDVRTITNAIFRFNGAGYIDVKHPSHIWIVALGDSPKPRKLTDGKYAENEFLWRGNDEILFTTQRVDEPYFQLPFEDLYSVPASGGEPKLVVHVPLGVNEMQLSPDGKRIAFRSQVNEPIRSYTQPDLFVLELAPNAVPKNLTADFDNDVGAGIGGDNAPPRAGGDTHPIWASDGRSIVDVVTTSGRANLMRFGLDGKRSEVTTGNQTVQRFSSADGGKNFALLISTPTLIGDLFTATGKRLTNVNSKAFKDIQLCAPEEIWYPSFDGRKIQAWVQKPVDYDPHKKYPLILNIHGGPHTAYGWVFDHEFHYLAAKGYVVLYPNPRGSTSYGQEFGNIIQYKYPGDDAKDLLAGVDYLVQKGIADPEKLGITGGSGGGVLTNWIVTHDQRFKAAVSQRDISDWQTFWYSADFWLNKPIWFREPPFRNPKEYTERSAITYVENLHTPIAFILGESDDRTPPITGGEELFRALKYLHRPTAMVRFPGETHELSRSGQPWHRIERLESIAGWFDKWMLGQDVAQFREVVSAPANSERSQ
jgi:dipeptidyl aminopeptidase/acylaminoacyl peptidase